MAARLLTRARHERHLVDRLVDDRHRLAFKDGALGGAGGEPPRYRRELGTDLPYHAPLPCPVETRGVARDRGYPPQVRAITTSFSPPVATVRARTMPGHHPRFVKSDDGRSAARHRRQAAEVRVAVRTPKGVDVNDVLIQRSHQPPEPGRVESLEPGNAGRPGRGSVES